MDNLNMDTIKVLRDVESQTLAEICEDFNSYYNESSSEEWGL